MGVEEFLNIEEEHKREFSELLQYCLASGRIDQILFTTTMVVLNFVQNFSNQS